MKKARKGRAATIVIWSVIEVIIVGIVVNSVFKLIDLKMGKWISENPRLACLILLIVVAFVVVINLIRDYKSKNTCDSDTNSGVIETEGQNTIMSKQGNDENPPKKTVHDIEVETIEMLRDEVAKNHMWKAERLSIIIMYLRDLANGIVRPLGYYRDLYLKKTNLIEKIIPAKKVINTYEAEEKEIPSGEAVVGGTTYSGVTTNGAAGEKIVDENSASDRNGEES